MKIINFFNTVVLYATTILAGPRPPSLATNINDGGVSSNGTWNNVTLQERPPYAYSNLLLPQVPNSGFIAEDYKPRIPAPEETCHDPAKKSIPGDVMVGCFKDTTHSDVENANEAIQNFVRWTQHGKKSTGVPKWH
ncbi:hypothetical protein F5Y15DRAFT_413634 [Xylariaceae sp. FL0016]|nr:hypothetical protein F5Y15DRAFT_413634 [Xylariaceae sp. FL0016]